MRARSPQGELELRLEEGERSPQVVARVGDEAPLPREPRLEPGEHRVQGLAEPVDLVVRLRERETLPRPLAGDLVGAAPHRLDGSQRRGREEVARDGRDEKRQRTDDEELGEQSVERFLPVLERSADDEDELLSARRA